MKVLNFGSLNYDYVYEVDHMMRAGETQASKSRQIFLGGKGFNQSVALAKAGVPVFHAGALGDDSEMFLKACEEYGIDTKYIQSLAGPSGHTVIQIDKEAQNCILLYGGANQEITEEFVEKVLADFAAGDIIILQNEVSSLSFIIDLAYQKGMQIIFNPSPYNETVDECDLSKVSIFLLNEIEGEMMTGHSEPKVILASMKDKFPKAKVVLTLGENGVIYQDEREVVEQGIFPVKAVDTTAAGDTFTGYFVAGLLAEEPIKEVLRKASKASSIAVSRKGAADSIPVKDEIF